jgi:HK97 family phage major capsid protein
MSPRVKPRATLHDAERIRARAELSGDLQELEAARKIHLAITARSPYGRDSEHSWVLDTARAAGDQPTNLDVRQRLQHHAASEQRAVTSTTLGGLIPSTIPPWVAEAVAYGLRSTAPLASALERLDLPPVGMNAPWAKVTTAATVNVQTAENSALPASADLAVPSATDGLKTIGGYLDFSAQSQELSGGWFDKIAGEELGRAYGARLEQQLWNGSGSAGQLTGFAVMTGNSSSTVAGQTLANQTAKIADQHQQVSNNLGSLPDLIALAPRRYDALQAATAALGLPVENIFPASVRANVIVSPAAPTNLNTNEDWIVILNRAAVPLVSDPQPHLEYHQQGPSAGTNLSYRWLIYNYAALGVSRRPEGVGTVKGLTAPTF